MWVILSLIYAFTNAIYTNYNDKRHYNGYILGMWRGYGVSILVIPLFFTIPLELNRNYLLILIIQGILIGIYDSHIFFASMRYGGNTGSGFMSTAVLITFFLWWLIHIEDFKTLLQYPTYLITLMLILIAYSVSYWKMMRVKADTDAEKYLYPAVFALALMSIATHYIAIQGSKMYTGIIYYLSISCFISGIYNTLMYYKYKKQFPQIKKPTLKDGIWLILFSAILISAKTAAMRLCPNPGYVVAVLLTSPLFSELMKTHRLKITPWVISTIILLICLIL